MRRVLLYLVIININLFLFGQYASSDTNLGLHGVVTWIDSTHLKVEYDWADDSQLSDWVLTSGTSLLRDNGQVIISGGNVSIPAMIWKQEIKCSRIIAKNTSPLSSAGHLNFYSNLGSFTGNNYLPNPGLGAVLSYNKNFWTHDGSNAGDIGAPFLEQGVPNDYEFNITTEGMTIMSSVNYVVYSYINSCVPEADRTIALGGWGGNTSWGKLTIEGEIITPWQDKPVPPGFINIQSMGAVFAPVIEVVDTALIEWVFNDSTTSKSETPLKDYGTIGSRHNYLKVTPWSALIGINVGYDASDGGYGSFAVVDNQHVLGFQNLNLAKDSLQYICASYNPITELDLSELTALKFIELFNCHDLVRFRLGSHPVLERLCVEDCNLDSIDISGCLAMEDLRAALNNYKSIIWGSSGQKLWHICTRDNPQITNNMPALMQFPLLKELLTWNDNQSGTFVCHSGVIRSIVAEQNHYTGADISRCKSLTIFSLSGSHLVSLDLGSADQLTNLRLTDCGLTKPMVDYVLHTIDAACRSNGFLELNGNIAPSAEGIFHYNNLKARGWTILLSDIIPVAGISIAGAGGETTITSDKGTLQLNATIIPGNASDTTVSWSVVNGSGEASISADGLVTAISDGTVTARATTNDGSGFYDTLVIRISNQAGSVGIPFTITEIDPLNITVTQNEIKTQLSDEYISCKALLYNIKGELVLSKFVESDVLSFDISSLPSGIFIQVLLNGKFLKVAKVVKP